jgi:uncharacterized protein YjbI with pentapeptide repeats
MHRKSTSRSIGFWFGCWCSAIVITGIAPANGETRSPLARLLADKSCQNCDLRKVDLNGVDLSGAKLQGANFTGASLRGAVLIGANLNGATFQEADLAGSMMTAAKIDGTSFRFANLENAVLYRAKAKKIPADFTGAILKQTQLPSGKIVKEVLATGEWKM